MQEDGQYIFRSSIFINPYEFIMHFQTSTLCPLSLFVSLYYHSKPSSVLPPLYLIGWESLRLFLACNVLANAVAIMHSLWSGRKHPAQPRLGHFPCRVLHIPSQQSGESMSSLVEAAQLTVHT